MTLRIGTRGSRLARAQSRTVAAALEAHGARTEMVVIETAGDADRVSAFSAIGTAGIFVREIQRALLEERIDLAVHSYKDLPSDVPAELVVAAVPARADPRDRLIVRAACEDASRPHLPVPPRARVGTSAARRRVLVEELRPDVETRPLRGNVNTRLDKVARGDYDAIILAAAGLDRLALSGYRLPDGVVAHDLDPSTFVPAPSQGALGLEIRRGDGETRELVSRLDDAVTSRTVALERRLLERLQAGCDVAFGAWCTQDADGMFTLRGLLEHDGSVRRASGKGDAPDEVVASVHEKLLRPRREALA